MSARSHSKYLRQEKAKDDKRQSILSAEGIESNPHHYAVKSDTLMPLNKKVMCPFCLGLEEFRLFLTSTKKGISRSVVKCPICGQGFFMRTLLNMSKWTAKQYADWVQPYSHSGFWKKINYSVWKDRLRLMGWTEAFWDRYKELKGDDTSESYEDHMAKAQTEWQTQTQNESF